MDNGLQREAEMLLDCYFLDPRDIDAVVEEWCSAREYEVWEYRTALADLQKIAQKFKLKRLGTWDEFDAGITRAARGEQQ